MNGNRFLHSIRLRNLLSYGPESESIDLQPLNVLIGPNGSGKSNLLAGIGLLKAAAGEFAQAIEDGGGTRNWLWKGIKGTPVAEIDAVLNWPLEDRRRIGLDDERAPLRYHLEFTGVPDGLEIVAEALGYNTSDFGQRSVPYLLRRTSPPMALVHNAKMIDTPEGPMPGYSYSSIEAPNPDQPLLSRQPDPVIFPGTGYAARELDSIRLYRDWDFGPSAVVRQPRALGRLAVVLDEDCGNLSTVIHFLRQLPTFQTDTLERMKAVYDRIEELDALELGGFALPAIKERGAKDFIPISRWSDGTLRFLCLLLILTNPDPPPLLCIEEPEIGMHPDIIPTIADLLIEASGKMQLVVTTHSEMLVSALRDVPDSVMVCDWRDNQTILRRLDARRMEAWLKDADLGDLWIRGELGGTRW